MSTNAASISMMTPVAVRIEPSRGWASLKLKDLWTHRELLYFLTWRDIKVRYKQTVLGAAWAILQPVLTMLVFTLFFGGLAKVGSDGLPYPVFSFAGLLPWTFFSQGLTQSAASLVGSSNLIRKVYFPRLVIPISSVLGGLVDLGIAFIVLVGLMAYYRTWPSASVLFLPLLLLLAVGATLGAGMWLAALNVEYRDVRYVVPFFVQLWLFVTPVIYPASKVAAKLHALGIPVWIYGINPMVSVVEGFRWALLGTGTMRASWLATGVAVTALLLVSGAFYLRRMERTFADVV
jgi:homopolymeric O-antigen transport system permease protein